MSLGQNIFSLRTAREMSQLELAEALGVSRQSISKWETDASVPELEKLIKLTELFGITLDELVLAQPSAEKEETPPEQEKCAPSAAQRSGRKTVGIVGIILLCMAFLIILLLGSLGALLGGLIVALPFIVCGLICLLAKRLAGLYCGWVSFFFAAAYLQFATGVNWAWIFNIFLWKNAGFSIQMIISAALLLAYIALLLSTGYCLRRPHIDLHQNWKKPLILALVLLALSLGLHLASDKLSAALIESQKYDLMSLWNFFFLLARSIIPIFFVCLASRCITWKK